ncbi:MAG: aminotransferase class V-fold PLP-dependent enzyme [Pseudomonadales bacterium]
MSSLIESIRDNVIGDSLNISTPFGEKPLVYADYTASGRSLQSIESFIQQKVLPWYANTHTESSFTGRQTTRLREEARTTIRDAVNGKEDDLVIFCGSGATAAINKLIDILNMRLPADLDREYQLDARIPANNRPVVFIGPYEHHSNELPWRESIAEMVCIPLTSEGSMDSKELEIQLKKYQHRKLKIGSFSAASNVTGLKTDSASISRLLHRYGALAFWDYAAAAPYTAIDMTGEETAEGDSSKDAVFVSPHKFIGGPGTPGILVVKKDLLRNSVPAVPGGGTVSFVTPEEHSYIADGERREEGGTPAIIESIRAGLVFKLQQQVGTTQIEAREKDFIQRAIAVWQQNPNVEILGCPTKERLSIVSLQINCQGHFLHYGFVVALLNDLFGIQSRGGCSCAGPYGHQLLGIDRHASKEIERAVALGHMIIRPGWVRVNFNYFISEETFQYIVQAIDMVASHGWRLLPYYKFDESSAIWRFQEQEPAVVASLTQFNVEEQNSETYEKQHISLQQTLLAAKQEMLTERASETSYALQFPTEFESLRWFTLPQEIAPI